MLDLAALADFLVVAEHLSISAAARATGRPKATLSRNVRLLEAALGARLFDRDTRGFRLTAAGEELADRARAPFGRIEEAARDIAGDRDRVRGTLRISATMVFCETVLSRVAGGFVARFPDARIEVVAEDRGASIVERGCDLVIRVNPAPTEDLVGRRLLQERLQVVTTPELADAEPVYSVLASGQSEASWPVERSGRRELLSHVPRVRVPTLTHARKAALAGGGAALIPSFLVRDDISAGRLAPLGVFLGPAAEIWALHLTRRLNSATLQAFLDHLSESLPGSTLDVERT